jgi:hypothetical protein
MKSFVAIPVLTIFVVIVKTVKFFTSLIPRSVLHLTAGTEEFLTVSTVIIRGRATIFIYISWDVRREASLEI